MDENDETGADLADSEADTTAPTSETPRFYANGFAVRASNADVRIVLMLDGRPVQVTHLSYTLAKTLVKKLGVFVDDFETKVGREMLTTDDVTAAYAEKES